MDRLQDRSGGGKGEAGAAEFLRDQRCEVAGLCESPDELGGIGTFPIEPAPVFTWEARAELCNLRADFGMRVGGRHLVHIWSPKVLDRCLGAGFPACKPAQEDPLRAQSSPKNRRRSCLSDRFRMPCNAAML